MGGDSIQGHHAICQRRPQKVFIWLQIVVGSLLCWTTIDSAPPGIEINLEARWPPHVTRKTFPVAFSYLVPSDSRATVFACYCFVESQRPVDVY